MSMRMFVCTQHFYRGGAPVTGSGRLERQSGERQTISQPAVLQPAAAYTNPREPDTRRSALLHLSQEGDKRGRAGGGGNWAAPPTPPCGFSPSRGRMPGVGGGWTVSSASSRCPPRGTGSHAPRGQAKLSAPDWQQCRLPTRPGLKHGSVCVCGVHMHVCAVCSCMYEQAPPISTLVELMVESPLFI